MMKRLFLALVIVLAATVGAVRLRHPSNDRIWSSDQAVLPEAEVQGHTVRIWHVRNFRYRTPQDYDRVWYDTTYDLDRLRRAWFVVEPFSGWRGPAHTFVSFEFDSARFVAISVEIRKERGESFSPLRGLMRSYELMYVVGDERDLIALRANYRHDSVYVYPVRAEPQKVRELFLAMLARADTLRAHPEFYNTLTSSCTTNIVRHINRIAPHRVPWSWRVLLPGYSDRLAYDIGLLDTTLPFDQARERFKINARALRWASAPDFSMRIRDTTALASAGAP